VGGCCSRTVSPARGDAAPPCVAWFMVAVGGCCRFADSAAAADAAVLESAAPMAEVGGCCPVVVPVGPAVGPDPASRDASSLVRFSISAIHGAGRRRAKWQSNNGASSKQQCDCFHELFSR